MNTIGVVGTNKKTSPIEVGLDRQRTCLTALHEAINALEDRLRTVIAPSPPQPPEGAAMENPTQLIEVIAQRNAAIETACHRLQEIMGRLEL